MRFKYRLNDLTNGQQKWRPIVLPLFLVLILSPSATHSAFSFTSSSRLASTTNRNLKPQIRSDHSNSKIFFVKIANRMNTQYGPSIASKVSSYAADSYATALSSKGTADQLGRRLNSDLYKLPLKFISNARPVLVKGIKTALAPRAEHHLLPHTPSSSSQSTQHHRQGGLSPQQVGLSLLHSSSSAAATIATALASKKLHKNVYRFLKENSINKFSKAPKRRVVHLPTKFVSSAQPWRALIMTDTFKNLGADRKITDQRIFNTPAAELFAENLRKNFKLNNSNHSFRTINSNRID